MASPSRPTLANLKNKKAAVIYLTTDDSAVPEVPENAFEYDWFNTPEAASNCFDDMVAFNKADVKEHGNDVVFLVAEVTDTKEMKFGRFDVQPVTDKTKKWLSDVKKDPLHRVVFPEISAAEKTAKKTEAKAKVKPRKKSAEASVTNIEDAKKKAPAKRVTPKKATAKKATPAKKTPTKKAAAPAKATTSDSTDKTARLRKRLAAKKVEPAST